MTYYNYAELSGVVSKISGQTLILDVTRKSNYVDKLKIIVSKNDIVKIQIGSMIRVCGELCYSGHEIAVKGYEVLIYQSVGEYYNHNKEDRNLIILDGILSSAPQLRTTHNGINVLDVKMKVGIKDRGMNRSVPCIAFNKIIPIIFNNVRQGSKISLRGRLQKRSFYSKAEDTVKTISEVAINKCTILDDNLDKKRLGKIA